jgi:hypothetical protein
LRTLLDSPAVKEKPMHVTPPQNAQPPANSRPLAPTPPKTSPQPTLSRPQKWVQTLLFPWLRPAPQPRKPRRG